MDQNAPTRTPSLSLCSLRPVSPSPTTPPRHCIPFRPDTPPTVQEGWLERVSFYCEQERQNDPIDQASMRASGRNPFVRSVRSEAMRGMEIGTPMWGRESRGREEQSVYRACELSSGRRRHWKNRTEINRSIFFAELEHCLSFPSSVLRPLLPHLSDPLPRTTPGFTFILPPPCANLSLLTVSLASPPPDAPLVYTTAFLPAKLLRSLPCYCADQDCVRGLPMSIEPPLLLL